MPLTAVLPDGPPLTLEIEPLAHLSLAEFYDFCQKNRDLRLERTAGGELVVMPPTGGATGNKSLRVAMQLGTWADRDHSGVAFDSSTAFVLPNGAVRSPDASWVKRSRLAGLSRDEKERFLPLCPDFVVELWSPSDSLRMLQAKMVEYRENGASLGWLIDPQNQRVEVYRQGRPAETLEAPAAVSAEPVLPGFELDIRPIWSPGW